LNVYLGIWRIVLFISCKLLCQFVICPSCNKVHIGCNKKKHWQLTLRWTLINTRLAVKILPWYLKNCIQIGIFLRALNIFYVIRTGTICLLTNICWALRVTVHLKGCNKKKHWQLTLRWTLINTRLAVKIEVDLFQHWQLTLRWTLINTRLWHTSLTVGINKKPWHTSFMVGIN
jgi:hypothetical protein